MAERDTPLSWRFQKLKERPKLLRNVPILEARRLPLSSKIDDCVFIACPSGRKELFPR
jgi:hypothetical protein